MPVERKRAEMRSAAFSTLARKLSRVGISRDAAQIIVDIADDLLNWDSCLLTMYCVAQDLDTPLLSIDTIDGRRVDVTALTPAGPPTVRGRRLIEQGAELVLRGEPLAFAGDSIPFGDEQRPSASIIGVPIRHAAAVIGTLSIYSYQTDAYDRRALLDLQALADHCGEALNRIQAEEALALSEGLFREAFDHAPIGMLLNSPEGRRLKVNRAFCKMLGYSEDELLEQNFWAVMHPDYQPKAQDDFSRLLAKTTEIDRQETPYVHKDGHVVWAKISSTIVRDAGGKPRFVIAEAEDITQQKQTKEALALSESLIRGAFDHAPIGMLVNSTEGRRLKVNRAFCEMLGYSEAELLQSDFWSVLHPDHRQQARDSLSTVLTGKTGIDRLITRYLHKDGHVVWARFSETVVRGANGSPLFLVAQVEDITEQKHAEEALALSEDLLRGAFDYAPIGMVMNAPDGRRLKVNAAFCELVGYSEEELLGADLKSIIHPDDLDRIDIAMKRLMEGKAVLDHGEWRYIHRDGHIVWAALTYTIVRSTEGRPLYIIGQVEDITERRRAEESLNLFRTLIDRSSDAIYVIDPDTLRFLDCNERAHQILGYSREEFLCLTVFDLDPIVDQSTVARIQEQTEKTEFACFESVNKRKDGSTFPVEVNVKLVRLERDYRIAVVRDITDRKRADERLNQTKSQLAEAQHVGRMGSWNWDVKRNVLTWSDELYSLFGLAPQQIEPAVEAYLERIHPEDREFVSRAIEESLESLDPFSHALRIIRADGEVRVFQTQANVLGDENGSAIRMFGICQDVTERKIAEEQLKATSEQLRALSASLRSAREAEGRRIAREIHDELGAALTGLKWHLEEISNGRADSEPLPDRLRMKVKSMVSLADTTINTVQRIASELRPSVLDDLGLASAIQWQSRQFQARTGITNCCDCAIEDIDLDQEQATAIFRIFQEALTNVLRHAQATRVDTVVREEAGELILMVRDNGRGITPEEKSRSQSLGLVGMRERAYLIGGTIDIEGVDQEGTLVTVRIPISSQV